MIYSSSTTNIFLEVSQFNYDSAQKTIAFISFNFLIIILAYLWGSLNTSILVSKFIFKNDIRQYGSGNAGSTNIKRKFGTKVAGLIFLTDILKVYLVSVILYFTNNYAVGFEATNGMKSIFVVVPQLAIAAIVVGHIYPIFFKFKGGKGAATLVGFYLSVNIILFLIGFVLWVTILYTSKMASVATTLANLIAIPLFFIPWFDTSVLGFLIPDWPSIGSYPLSTLHSGLIFLVTSALVIFSHRSNLARVFKGEERKIKSKKA
ncbi:glycerol-3-phosphate acyltransferase PlsY [Mycoplasma testudineum]|uniref:Glycerol-3-phosphate acyltransferase n=1 Tax=Mycoplasma testudineum TaxID=244584 RepID=A0A4R6IGV4_9MOLU|nr:glycerol-3-phosphate acyltransferase [Mycoplasma testudineum]OYD27140.1 hypothetical protein CG473_00655 [Mycoplasma testudineum]TDO21106.1 glycerol-3-phosphate acyltransferase PlsY [Mycoplasma testudineum]